MQKRVGQVSRFSRSCLKFSGLRMCIAAVAVFLVGCRADLKSNLTEQEANQILAILLENNISATKEFTDEDRVTLQVDEEDMLGAIKLLEHNGFPRKSRESLGSVFQKTGIMSSPFEERIRFIYALSEELSATLSEIDGVHTARVHIVLPDDPELGEKVVPSSAAVFIKHRSDADLDFFSPQIKRLVSNAIEGVSYDKVSVVLVEAEKRKISNISGQADLIDTISGIKISSADKGLFNTIFYSTVAALVTLVLLNVATAFGWLRSRNKMVGRGAGKTANLKPA